MGILLTPSQESSLDLHANLAVTANAGAGKTYVLARRFVEILLRTGAGISETVAITFTEQAAGQLKKKIHDVIVAMESDPAAGRGTRETLRDIRVRLASAQIGTIHSFCARLLRLYPVESGVDAAFSVIEGQDRERLIHDSVREALELLLARDRDGQDRTDVRSLARMLGPVKLERCVVQLLRQREQIFRFTGGSGVTGALNGSGSAVAPLPVIAAAIVRRAGDSGWVGNVAGIARAARGKQAGEVLTLLEGWGAAADDMRKAGILHEAGKLIFTAAGEYRTRFLGKAVTAEELPASGSVRKFFLHHQPVLHSLLASDAAGTQERFRRHLSALLAVCDEALRIYEAGKDEPGVLDFEDLQLKTLGLLSDDAVCDRIAAGYRYFLVDEFQDTNDLQYSILKRLLAGFRRGNAFIVGDPKQSIYGFRNAEVAVFTEACREISRSRDARSAEGPREGPIVLSESFRPLPVIAAFINTLFSRLLGGAGTLPEVPYDDLIVAREGRETGAVELLLVDDGVTGSGRPATDECAAVASRILEITRPGDGPAGYGPFRFGDCAVLLRDRKHLMELERAFENASIPYVLAGGVGYFQTQEVFDFLNYLSFLADHGDDVALAGILRSPFFGLADDDLYLISLEREDTLWAKLGSFCDDNPAHLPGQRARRLLGRHAGLKDRIPVSRLLRTIAGDTGWLGTIAGLAHGPQHRENFLKLLDLARVNESRGVSSLYDFVDFLSHHADTEEREGQASTAMADQSVKIMTIHAAKGLEFPVVFLPFSHRKSRGEGELLVDPRHGIGFGIDSPDGGGKVDPPSMLYLKLLSREKRLAEEKRVFYVACTRARDMLVISGREPVAPRGGSEDHSPLGALIQVFGGLPPGEGPGVIDAGRRVVRFARSDGGRMVYEDREMDLRIPVQRPGGEVVGPVPEKRVTETEGPPELLTASLEDRSGGESYSATQIRTYLDCPARYYFRYVLGVGAPTAVRVSPEGGADAGEHDRDDAGIEGEVTHRILSEITDPAVDPDRLRSRIASLSAAAAREGDGGTLASKVLANVLSFTDSETGREILNAAEPATEFRMSTLVDRAVLSGIIDRLYRGRSGLWEIADYKTDEVGPEEFEHRAASYRWQLAVYALLVHRRFDQPTVRARLLFLKGGHPEVNFDFDRAQLSAIAVQIGDVISGIRRGEFPGRHPACDGCPDTRRTFCPDGTAAPR